MRDALKLPLACLLLLVPSALLANTADSFDIDRYSTAGEGMFETLHVEQTQALAAALESGILGEDTEILIAETAAGQLALVKDQMAFHHIAQGSAVDPGTQRSKDWIATF